METYEINIPQWIKVVSAKVGRVNSIRKIFYKSNLTINEIIDYQDLWEVMTMLERNKTVRKLSKLN